MQTVQVVLDEDLLQATDAAARQAQVNRSALVRKALRAYLAQLRRRALEAQDRKGYEHLADTTEDLEGWEKIALWPEG